LTGYIRSYFTEDIGGVKVENWRGIWMGPFLLTLVCMLVFALLFKEEQIGEIAEETKAKPEAAPVLS
jgi:hypothetical protein